VYLRANLGSSYVSQFLLTNTEMWPSDITAEKLPLWHGLNERIQTLNKFIDELKKVSAVVPPMRKLCGLWVRFCPKPAAVSMIGFQCFQCLTGWLGMASRTDLPS
jgi:hypothetical protein